MADPMHEGYEHCMRCSDGVGGRGIVIHTSLRSSMARSTLYCLRSSA